MKKQLCNRCQREMDWEEVQLIESMPRGELIKVALGFRKVARESELKLAKIRK